MQWPTARVPNFAIRNLERSHRRHYFAYYRSIEVDLNRISAFVDDDKALVRIIQGKFIHGCRAVLKS